MKLVNQRIFDIRNNNESVFDIYSVIKSAMKVFFFFFSAFMQKLMFLLRASETLVSLLFFFFFFWLLHAKKLT